MSEKKKAENTEETKGEELDLEELKDVSGGTIGDVRYTKTKPISKKTQENI